MGSRPLTQLNTVVAYLAENDINSEPVNFRLADFATLGKAIWQAVAGGEAAGKWTEILSKMQIEQEDFALEGDTLPIVILEWMGSENSKGPIEPSKLYKELHKTAEEKEIEFDYKNSRAVGRRLSNIRSSLEERFDVKIKETKGRGNRKYRTFIKIIKDES